MAQYVDESIHPDRNASFPTETPPMNPVKDKVKDIVDVLKFKSVKDFDADPRATLEGYHFTDITSEMMGRWLDRISMVHARGGDCFALAGYRGVGKSHFLATLGAIVSHTELRSVVSDPHIAAGAQRLLRRHYPVFSVRRGTAETLIEEFEQAVAREFPGKDFVPDGTINTILDFIDKATGEMPAVILVDTAFERGVRVSRDDGTTLGKIAELVRGQNIFIGVALDDDIAGADGVNADIARTYSISYLDTEHLYTVVNRHVFPKYQGKEPVLSEVYRYFRTVLPNFRWSEQKFSSLYPLHPSILEVAPFIRLHVHDFAVLGFAQEAGERILGRPATSLIALDEVFDKVEQNLRGIEDLAEPFAAFDRISKEVVSKIPVIQRLQAKLILKALLLLSLDGRGASAAEIAESMLIFDEAEPEKAYRTIEEIITKFAEALPEEIRQVTLEGREPRYGFRMTSKDEINVALDEAAAKCSDSVVADVLAKLFQDRYPDGSWSSEEGSFINRSVECSLNWRGSIRRGRLSFVSDTNAAVKAGSRDQALDWSVRVELLDPDPETDPATGDVVYWRPDELSLSEKDTLRRYYVLTTDTTIRTTYSEQLHAPLQSHSVAAARVLKRSFLDDGKLVVGGFDFNFSEDARESQSLSELFSRMLETYFDTRFPEHPEFSSLLGPAESNILISGLYGGGELSGFEELVRNFAIPLGLVRETEEKFELVPVETIEELPYIAQLIEQLNGAGGTFSMEDVGSILGASPYGFVRESQRILLTALVAGRRIDFVTAKGDRINKRSLDLRLIWDDITGIARSVENVLSNERLVHWAKLLSGDQVFASFTDAKDLDQLRRSLSLRYGEWRKERILDRFESLPDEVFNTRIWRTGSSAAKSFTALFEIFGRVLNGETEPVVGISQAANLFSDSDEEYGRRVAELDTIRHFVKGTIIRDSVLSYVFSADHSSDMDLEGLRNRLIDAANLCILDPSESRNREAALLFDKFKKDYVAFFTQQHDAIMHAHNLQEKFNAVIASSDWNEFHSLASYGLADPEDQRTIAEQKSRFNDLDCRFDTAKLASTIGRCHCVFSLQNTESWAWLPSEMMEALSSGVDRFRARLANDRKAIIENLGKIRAKNDQDRALVAADLIKKLSGNGKLPPITLVEAAVLADAIRTNKATNTKTPSKPGRSEPALGEAAAVEPEVVELVPA